MHYTFQKSADIAFSKRIDYIRACIETHESDKAKIRPKLITLERYKLEAKQRKAEDRRREMEAGADVAGAASGAVAAGVNASQSCVLL